MRTAGSLLGDFLEAGEKNLEAKYQKTTIRMIPVKLNPPPACCLPCGAAAVSPPSTTAVGGAMESEDFEKAMEDMLVAYYC